LITSPFSGYSLDTDIRELDVRKCIRGLMDGTNIGTMGSDASTTLGTTTFIDSCGPSELGYAQLAPKVINAGRCWISDRQGIGNQGFTLGAFECDSFAKVRIPLNTPANGSVCRVGYYPGHTEHSSFSNGAYFHCYTAAGAAAGTTTWSIVLAVNGTGELDPLPSYVFTKDTGVLVSSWATLGVWVNKNATEVLFYINGKVVHRDTDPNHIVSVRQMVSFAYAKAVGVGLQCGVSLRMSAIVEASVLMKVDVEWCRYRHYMER